MLQNILTSLINTEGKGNVIKRIVKEKKIDGLEKILNIAKYETKKNLNRRNSYLH